MKLYWFHLAAVANHYQISVFKQHKYILLKFRTSEPTMGPQDYISSGGSEETVSLPFPASRVACISCPMAPSSNFKTCSLISSL